MRKIVLTILVLMIFAPRAFAQTPVSEDALKAAFIFHFISFTQWNDHSPDYYVCIPDDEELRRTARESFKGKMVNNRKVIVVDRSEGCHILIADRVPSTETMLTIGSLVQGAQFEFRLIDNKMKFAIDLARVKRSKLKISSQLLKLAILENAS